MQPEQTVQRSVLDYLRWKNIFCWKVTTTGIYVKSRNTWIPNQASGVSDILGILPDGRLLAIEVKAPKGKVSPHQQQFLDDINQRNGIAFVARGIEDVEKFLQPYLTRHDIRSSAVC